MISNRRGEAATGMYNNRLARARARAATRNRRSIFRERHSGRRVGRISSSLTTRLSFVLEPESKPDNSEIIYEV